ncbi:hypothetical protein P3T76_001586 [Phytophthora citrophthora]|uniref:Uncharacterized protein n=1 Tax=Phytophthora citrophthora TaxID=4793 RepID=A0AAD9GZM4_9STRA|nr:hypothetical protein P3T76_001586 [Phytophthora citrophthora]
MFIAPQTIARAVAPEPSLPTFSMREAHFRKARDANTLVFSVPVRSSLLLPLLRPVCHAYEQQDSRCLHLLQAAALVPSCKCNKLLKTVTQALKMPVSAATKSLLEDKLLPTITQLREDKEDSTRPLVALQLKEKVAECLRCWIAEPVEGFVLRKEHVINGMRLDDLVATPAGAGYLRGYRLEDGFCTVVYPWGHGFVHVKDVEKVQKALEKHLKKRTYNEYVALEHQQLYEQIEGLLDNLPPAVPEEGDSAKKEEAAAGDGEEVGIEEFKDLLKSLEEEHVDTTVLREDLGLLRRVQALANKVKELHRSQTAKEPEQKMPRTEESSVTVVDDDQQKTEGVEQTEKEQEGQKQEQEGEPQVSEEMKEERSGEMKETDE